MKKVLVVLGIFIVIAGVIGFVKYRNQSIVPEVKEIAAEANTNVAVQNTTVKAENKVTNNTIENKAIENKTVVKKTTENKIEENKATESKVIKKDASKEETKKETEVSSKKTIAIDPGHQAKGNSAKEPIGPGAKETKAKVTTGATGTFTKQKESELVLKVALQLEKALKQEGYNVIMTRRTNNVNISNSERAKIANDANADVFIRIHADSYSDASVNRYINLMPNS